MPSGCWAKVGGGGGEEVVPPRACQAGPSEGAVSWARCHQSGGSRKQHQPWARRPLLPGSQTRRPRGGRLTAPPRPAEEGREGGASTPPLRPQGPSSWGLRPPLRGPGCGPICPALAAVVSPGEPCWALWGEGGSEARCGGALLLGAGVSLTARRGRGALHAPQGLSRGLPRTPGFLLPAGTPGCAEMSDTQACVESLGAGSLGAGRQIPPRLRGLGDRPPTPPLLKESGCRCFRIHQTPHTLKRTHRGKNGF